jgi:hypothetical protein
MPASPLSAVERKTLEDIYRRLRGLEQSYQLNQSGSFAGPELEGILSCLGDLSQSANP